MRCDATECDMTPILLCSIGIMDRKGKDGLWSLTPSLENRSDGNKFDNYDFNFDPDRFEVCVFGWLAGFVYVVVMAVKRTDHSPAHA